jgi:hypothetical protein
MYGDTTLSLTPITSLPLRAPANVNVLNSYMGENITVCAQV